MNRREFIQGVAGLTLASFASQTIFAQDSPVRLKIVVFWQADFPIIDGLNITQEVLQNALGNHKLIFVNESELKAKLAEEIDVFINPYGSAFPKKCWSAILKYLQSGGNFVNLGGVPFAVPVQNLKAETRQVNYHKRLGITQSFEMSGNENDYFETRASGINSKIKPTRVFETYLKFSNVNDFPEEAGSDGRREAKVSALLFGHKRNKINPTETSNNFEEFVSKSRLFPMSAPIIEIDRLQGEFSGGRWVLANYEGAIDSETINTLVVNAAFGAFQVSCKPLPACFRNNESPVLQIDFNNPKGNLQIKSLVSVNVVNQNGENVWSSKFDLNSKEKVLVKINPLSKGYYIGSIYFQVTTKVGITHTLASNLGFWIYDEKLLASGKPFTADKHFLSRNGEPFPVVGTTYMASDVARRFLLEPNPAVWDKDFAEMKSAGVNMIRTGIWTAWKLYFDEKGNVKEEVLRAFEAFLLTAKKYDVPVMFTFFAFMPEMFGGKNAYLDPRSIAGQKQFLHAFASRAKNSPDIIWDLINEPSFANPKNLWSCRPNYDEFEKQAWKDWLLRRHNAKDETELREILSEKWRLNEADTLDLPKLEDFENVNILVKRRPFKAFEFRLFAQEIFANWAKEMSDTLKQFGNNFVTVGQDEAGTGDSPSTQFHADSVDFTGLHNWWANDDLLWDNVVTKSPNKPNLVQETGVMFYENQDGSAWRDEKTVAKLLERKMALSLGANACGFIEWIWNTNPFMDNENEAAIGFLRADGTAKPELQSFQQIAKFANDNRKYFKNKSDEKTLLVIPHSYQFLPRNYASEATKKAVRVFHYYCRRTLRAVSEYNLQAILKEETPPSLIILPSVNCFNEKAWKQLLELVKRGSTLAISGYFADDEYLIPQNRLKDLHSESIYSPIPVAQNEKIVIEGKTFRTHFGGEKIQQIRKANFIQDYLLNLSHYGNEVIWSPVPLELGDNLEAIAAFYNLALKKAKLLPYFSLKNDIPSILVRPTEFENAILYLVINESANNEYVEIAHLPTKTKIEFNLNAGQTNLIFIDKLTGKTLSYLR